MKCICMKLNAIDRRWFALRRRPCADRVLPADAHQEAMKE